MKFGLKLGGGTIPGIGGKAPGGIGGIPDIGGRVARDGGNPGGGTFGGNPVGGKPGGREPGTPEGKIGGVIGGGIIIGIPEIPKFNLELRFNSNDIGKSS